MWKMQAGGGGGEDKDVDRESGACTEIVLVCAGYLWRL